MSLLLYWVALIDGKCCCVRTSMRITYVHKHIHIYTYSWMYYTISMIIHIYIYWYISFRCLYTYLYPYFFPPCSQWIFRKGLSPNGGIFSSSEVTQKHKEQMEKDFEATSHRQNFSQPGLRRQQIDLRQRQGKLEFIKHQIEEWWCFFWTLLLFCSSVFSLGIHAITQW